MKAIVQDRFGPIDGLELRDVDMPVAGAEGVVVRVHAASVHAGDHHLTTGTPYALRALGFGFRGPKNSIRGTDVAGVVESVGAKVTAFRPGDEVLGTCNGAFAEYAVTTVDQLVAKPSRLTFEQAAAVPTSACTALLALRGLVEPGTRVLIIGAGGGVGTFAVQLARALGAHVTGVCGTHNVERVRALGAHDVIDYTRNDFTDTQYDLIVDTAGNRPLSHLRKALTHRGNLVLVGGEGGGRIIGAAVLRTLRAFLLSPFVSQTLSGLFVTARQDDLQYLMKLIDSGKVVPAIDRTYSLVDVPAAIRYQAAGHARGKVVITV